MPLPPGITTRTYSGTITGLDGTAGTGTMEFRLPYPLRDLDNNVVVGNDKHLTTTVTAGAFTIALPIAPWPYIVRIATDVLKDDYFLLVAAGTGPLKFADTYGTAAPITQVAFFALLHHLHSTEDITGLDDLLADVLTADDLTAALNLYLPRAGGTITAPITWDGTPTADGHLATKAYVDAHAGAEVPDVTLPLFNVETYGAVGDGVTDDYAAVREAWDAMLDSPVGGLLYFPRAVTYRVAATAPRLGPTAQAYALFPMPLVSAEGPVKKTFGVIGVGNPYAVRAASSFGAEGDAQQVATATILKVDYSTPFGWHATHGLPCVFGFPDADKTGHAEDNIVSNVHFYSDGMIIRQPDNPSLCGMNLELASTCHIKAIRFDVTSVLDQVPEPTHPTGASLLAPKSNNNVSIPIESFVAEGHYTGLPYTEHCDVTRAIVLRCKIAVSNRRSCSHYGKLGMLKLEQCPFQLAGYAPDGVGPNLGVVPWIGGTVVVDFVDVEHYAYEAREDNPAGVPWIYPPVHGCDIYAPNGGLGGSIRAYGRINSEPAPPTGIGVAPFGGGPDIYVIGNVESQLGFSGFGIYDYLGEPITVAGGKRHLGHAPTNPVVDPPNAPTIGVAVGGIESASFAFTPAVSGPAATSYTATARRVSDDVVVGTQSGGSSPIVVSGLTAAVAVYGTVHATNGIGSSAESAQSNQVTPTAPVSLPSDSFTGTGPLTTSTSGHTYLGNSDTTWARVSDRAVHANSGSAWINAVWLPAQLDCATEMTFLAVDSLEAGPIARVTDMDNLLYMDLVFSSGGTQVAVELYRRIAGSFAGQNFGNGGGGAAVVTGLTPGSAVTVRLECEGDDIRAYIDDVLATSGTDTTQAGTGVGFLWGAAAAATVDNLAVTAL